jgi:hypothetical protein
VQDYSSWRQVAGYFDGDGTLGISDTSNQPYKLGLNLIFVDQSKDQIGMIQRFLQRKGVITSNILKTSRGTAYMVAVSRFDSVLFCLKAMRPHLFKKAIEAQTGIDYYEGRIRGDELFKIFGEEVEAGRRERHDRKVAIHVPFTYPEGDALMKARRREKIIAVIEKSRAKVSRGDYDSIRRAHFVEGRSLSELRQMHPQYARETIRRILGRGRGYVLVEGEGRVTSAEEPRRRLPTER